MLSTALGVVEHFIVVVVSKSMWTGLNSERVIHKHF